MIHEEIKKRIDAIKNGKISELNNIPKRIGEKPSIEKVFINLIERKIQREVDRLNKAKNISLENKISCKLYGKTDGYIYQQECLDLWNWSVNGLYQPLKEWRDTLAKAPTKQEFKDKLTTLTYDVVYPEEITQG